MDNFSKYMNPPVEEKDNENLLFEFKFERGSINSNIINWCINNKIDYVTGKFGNAVYADVYKIDVYYKLILEHVADDIFKVSLVKDSFIERIGFDRKYPLNAA